MKTPRIESRPHREPHSSLRTSPLVRVCCVCKCVLNEHGHAARRVCEQDGTNLTHGYCTRCMADVLAEIENRFARAGWSLNVCQVKDNPFMRGRE